MDREDSNAWRTESTDLMVNWEQVADADVTSLRMALDFGINPEDLQAARSEATVDEPDPKVAEDKEYLRRLEEEDAMLFAEIEADLDELKILIKEELEDAAEEEEGMAVQPSREDLDHQPPETFEVTEVLRRRRRKDVPKATAVDDEAEEYNEDDYRYEYLVRWKDMANPTWERRGYLLDEGFGHLVKAFDAAKTPLTKPTSTKYNRPQKPSRPNLRRLSKAEKKAELERLEAQRVLLDKVKKENMKFIVDFDSIILKDEVTRSILNSLAWSDHRTTTMSMIELPPRELTPAGASSIALRCRSWFLSDGLWPIAFCPVGECATRPSFVSNVATARAKTVPLSHGTRAVREIIAGGLRVPGENGVTVLHGSALGVGIYSGRQPSVSCGYSGDTMFLCAGRESGNDVYTSYNVNVFFKSTLIVPVIAVKFRQLTAQERQSGLLQIHSKLPTRVVATLAELQAMPLYHNGWDG